MFTTYCRFQGRKRGTSKILKIEEANALGNVNRLIIVWPLLMYRGRVLYDLPHAPLETRETPSRMRDGRSSKSFETSSSVLGIFSSLPMPATTPTRRCCAVFACAKQGKRAKVLLDTGTSVAQESMELRPINGTVPLNRVRDTYLYIIKYFWGFLRPRLIAPWILLDELSIVRPFVPPVA
ncbi:hypothetical protein BDP81DRAFT_164812 [Colletotrichum phormii]|uniref:Uncharacterized protein n=1 Tax=Colletotrichum phormii TaxID=359342 RepID=A0AAI9ZYF0_9PEZI|nr:uncharacterized protein BDP81DRAFT_164812 [Colletotrichum phormii]KAK1640527.1 hypothetical protein BDP81DRAFT_164812 [Colletotrichum phormii]